MLIYVLIFGKTINNTRGWLQLPGVGFRLQPVEFVKPLTLLFLSWLASLPVLHHSWMKKWLPAALIALATAFPVALICLQPDVGTAMVYPGDAHVTLASRNSLAILRYCWPCGSIVGTSLLYQDEALSEGSRECLY